MFFGFSISKKNLLGFYLKKGFLNPHPLSLVSIIDDDIFNINRYLRVVIPNIWFLNKKETDNNKLKNYIEFFNIAKTRLWSN